MDEIQKELNGVVIGMSKNGYIDREHRELYDRYLNRRRDSAGAGTHKISHRMYEKFGKKPIPKATPTNKPLHPVVYNIKPGNLFNVKPGALSWTKDLLQSYKQSKQET